MIEIRQATINELESIIKIEKECFPQSEAATPDELYHNVSLHDVNGKYQTVFGLDVLTDYRRSGVAAKLLNYFINISKKRGKKGMVLTCKDHLISYYEKFGFKHCGVSASFHGGAKWNDMVMIF